MIFSVPVGIYLLNLILMLALVSSQDARGTIGDMFGASNALFSGLAFAGLFITILLQQKQMDMQRTELSETRKMYNSQRADSQISRMLDRLRDNLSLITFTEYNEVDEATTHRGIGAFKCMTNRAREFLNKELRDLPRKTELEEVVFMKEACSLLAGHIYEQGRYIKTLAALLETADSQPDTERLDHLKFIQSQTTSHELMYIILYSCLRGNEDSQVKAFLKTGLLFHAGTQCHLSTTIRDIFLYRCGAILPEKEDPPHFKLNKEAREIRRKLKPKKPKSNRF